MRHRRGDQHPPRRRPGAGLRPRATGIVHRDIKPDNVLLSAGSATVTDFGIAKAITAARTDGGGRDATLTQVGTSIGTPTYMAPEQAAADPNADHRVDLYAFGVMAYELIAGQPPFQGNTPARLLAAHMSETPRDLRSIRADIPPALAELIMACLAKDPDDRPQQARELVRVLETVTTSGNAAAVPAALRGGRIPIAKALGLWAAATAGVGVTAWAATDVIGLPDWVLPGSLGVMLAGLPVIGITAFVQRAAHRAYATTPQHTPGGGVPAPGHARDARPQGESARLLAPDLDRRRRRARRVRRAGGRVHGDPRVRHRAGGVAARARARSARRRPWSSPTSGAPAGDSTLGPTVAEALRTDLAQSSSLNVLTRASVREILGLMQRPAESVVPFELAREIATREGAKAVLDGEIVRLGQSYVVSARLVSALDGQELATFRETAENEDELIGALGDLSRAVREKAGESLRTIRASSELERVTTPSLAGAPQVRRGLGAGRRGRRDRPRARAAGGGRGARHRVRHGLAEDRGAAGQRGPGPHPRPRGHQHRVPPPRPAHRDGAAPHRGLLLHPRPPARPRPGARRLRGGHPARLDQHQRAEQRRRGV